jgi:hypothetical protein
VPHSWDACTVLHPNRWLPLSPSASLSRLHVKRSRGAWWPVLENRRRSKAVDGRAKLRTAACACASSSFRRGRRAASGEVDARRRPGSADPAYGDLLPGGARPPPPPSSSRSATKEDASRARWWPATSSLDSMEVDDGAGASPKVSPTGFTIYSGCCSSSSASCCFAPCRASTPTRLPPPSPYLDVRSSLPCLRARPGLGWCEAGRPPPQWRSAAPQPLPLLYSPSPVAPLRNRPRRRKRSRMRMLAAGLAATDSSSHLCARPQRTTTPGRSARGLENSVRRRRRSWRRGACSATRAEPDPRWCGARGFSDRPREATLTDAERDAEILLECSLL